MRKCFPVIDLGWDMGHISQLFMSAKEIAISTDRVVTFIFNGVKVEINKNTTPQMCDKVFEAIKSGDKYLDIRG